MKQRYVELDLLRTLAVVLMIIYHTCYDLQEFYGWKLGLFQYPVWSWIQHGTAGLFLLLVGCSFAISWNRHGTKNPDANHRHLYKKYLLRGRRFAAAGVFRRGKVSSNVIAGFEVSVGAIFHREANLRALRGFLK